jgi:hypothetical protein
MPRTERVRKRALLYNATQRNASMLVSNRLGQHGLVNRLLIGLGGTVPYSPPRLAVLWCVLTHSRCRASGCPQTLAVLRSIPIE